ncbi:DUF2637 domain-containing protein [Actinopolyspora mortivallis]|uniref:DUF2637 domain-containing protein n=1 Tax=Actinopolyspora mortivallis TaxID=33906 RepID=UPI00037327AA|nr:DUF2637 domain-containing protein [Actinopolyspora mortivallis]
MSNDSAPTERERVPSLMTRGSGRVADAIPTLGVAMVAAVAAVVSYCHMRDVALVAGETWRAWLLPLSVDGLSLRPARPGEPHNTASRSPE